MEYEEVVVIGGGITGLTAATELASMGKEVLVVDKSPFLGGHAAGLPCKATDRCLKCNDCLVEHGLKAFWQRGNIRYMTYTGVADITQEDGYYIVDLSTGPYLIDWSRCTSCGKCYDACKRSGKEGIVKAPSINIRPFYGIVQDKCTCDETGSAPVCAQVCPEDAVKILKDPLRSKVRTKGLIVATGYEPYEPPLDNRYGYGHLPDVITTVHADRMLREQGRVVRPSDGTIPQKIAFVQCVGSRDRRIGREYCSRVCCGYSLRMALRIIHILPEVEITVFYMDIQNFGKDFDKYYSQVCNKARLIRALPGDFYSSDSGKVKVSYFVPGRGVNISEDFDMVLLTVGLGPQESITPIAHKLGIERNDDGFLVATQTAAKKGIIIAGTAQGPMDVSECIADAKSKAMEMKEYLDT